jgi:hypothetical protein
MTPHQKAAVLRLALQAILDAVKEGGSLGAPGGVLYAASSVGCRCSSSRRSWPRWSIWAS